MVRVIKRYGGESRKLYDPRDSRYVALDEIAAWIRGGARVRVVDSRTGADVTAQTLAQVIYESERRGRGTAPAAWLEDVIRLGGRAVSAGVARLERGVGRLLEAASDDELHALRDGLVRLDRTLLALHPGPPHRRPRRRAVTRPRPRARRPRAEGASP